MKVEAVKNELEKLLSSLEEIYYTSKDMNTISKCREEYSIIKQYHLLILKNDTFSYVYKLRDTLVKEANKLETKYNELIKDYNNQKDEGLKSKLVPIINMYAYKIDAHNKIFNIISESLKNENDNVYDYSNNIISLLVKYNKESDPNILLEIYRLNDERRARYTAVYGEDVIRQVSILESLEERLSMCTNDMVSPYRVDKKTFISSLKDTITAINDYYFLDNKNSKYYKKNDEVYIRRLNLYIRKYRSMIKSLFKNDFHVIETQDGKVSTDELLNYLEVYNIDGTYEVFVNKNKGKSIGTNNINKKDYQSDVELVNRYIDKLIEDVDVKFKSKSIEIVDKSPREDLINERKELFEEIDSLPCLNVGEQNARR